MSCILFLLTSIHYDDLTSRFLAILFLKSCLFSSLRILSWAISEQLSKLLSAIWSPYTRTISDSSIILIQSRCLRRSFTSLCFFEIYIPSTLTLLESGWEIFTASDTPTHSGLVTCLQLLQPLPQASGALTLFHIVWLPSSPTAAPGHKHLGSVP